MKRKTQVANLHARTPEGLKKSLADNLKLGWQPVGPVKVDYHGRGPDGKDVVIHRVQVAREK